MAQTLSRIQPLHAELKPPRGAEPTGQVAHGQYPLYRMTRKMVVDKEVLRDDDGNEMWKTNPQGEKLYRMYRPIIGEEELLFYLQSDGQGNVVMVDYTPPTAEQIAAEQREQNVERAQRELAEALVDEGMTASELIAAIRGPVPTPDADDEGAVPPPDAEEEPEEREYPYNYGVGLWYLSEAHEAACEAGDAKGFKGSREEAEEKAEEWEQAAQNAAQVPEV